MAVHTRSNSTAAGSGQLDRRNGRATASVVFGLLSVLAIPAGVALSYYSATVTLIEASSSAGLAIAFGLYAIILARRGRDKVVRTLGRAGGRRTARVGKLLGALGLCMGISAGLAVGFYGLLTVFAKS